MAAGRPQSASNVAARATLLAALDQQAALDATGAGSDRTVRSSSGGSKRPCSALVRATPRPPPGEEPGARAPPRPSSAAPGRPSPLAAEPPQPPQHHAAAQAAASPADVFAAALRQLKHNVSEAAPPPRPAATEAPAGAWRRDAAAQVDLSGVAEAAAPGQEARRSRGGGGAVAGLASGAGGVAGVGVFPWPAWPAPAEQAPRPPQPQLFLPHPYLAPEAAEGTLLERRQPVVGGGPAAKAGQRRSDAADLALQSRAEYLRHDPILHHVEIFVRDAVALAEPPAAGHRAAPADGPLRRAGCLRGSICGYTAVVRRAAQPKDYSYDACRKDEVASRGGAAPRPSSAPPCRRARPAEPPPDVTYQLEPASPAGRPTQNAEYEKAVLQGERPFARRRGPCVEMLELAHKAIGQPTACQATSYQAWPPSPREQAPQAADYGTGPGGAAARRPRPPVAEARGEQRLVPTPRREAPAPQRPLSARQRRAAPPRPASISRPAVPSVVAPSPAARGTAGFHSEGAK